MDKVYAAVTTEIKRTDKEEKGADTTTVFKVPVGTSPVLGKPGALVTIIEFSDFQCPYCSKVEPTLKGLRAKYGDKIRTVWKNEPLPFHNRAEPAAELAMEARAQKGDAGFWAAHDKMFEQPVEAERRRPLQVRAGELRAQRRRGEERDRDQEAQEGDRRGLGRWRTTSRRSGYAALLRQRTAHRGRAAAGSVREDRRCEI